MEHIFVYAGAFLSLPLPPHLAAQAASAGLAMGHGEAGVFADYLRFSGVNPNINYVDVGGRLGISRTPHQALEAEMSYDLQRNYTATYNNGVSTAFVTAGIRPLTGFFGPKLQFGTSGPLRVFVTGKAGFVDFSVNNSGVTTGSSFTNAVSGAGGTGTQFAAYPGGGH